MSDRITYSEYDGLLDEVVVHKPNLFHLERMDDGHIWLSVDGLHINLHAEGTITTELIDGRL
jgi:hypothetical protein